MTDFDLTSIARPMIDMVWGIDRSETNGPVTINVMKSRVGGPDTRPDIFELSNDKGPFFALKMFGDTLTLRASEALFWATSIGYPCTIEKNIPRNVTWLRFDMSEHAALFKLFWL